MILDIIIIFQAIYAKTFPTIPPGTKFKTNGDDIRVSTSSIKAEMYKVEIRTKNITDRNCTLTI